MAVLDVPGLVRAMQAAKNGVVLGMVLIAFAGCALRSLPAPTSAPPSPAVPAAVAPPPPPSVPSPAPAAVAPIYPSIVGSALRNRTTDSANTGGGPVWNQPDSARPSSSKPQRYGTARGPLLYGLAQVSVPPNRNPGEIPTPAGTEEYELPANPMKHFVLMSADQVPVSEITRITARFSTGKSSKRIGLVFVHGYNVGFQAAAYRAAQMSLDMRLKSMPVFFSWASKAGTAAYWKDENTALQSVPDFKKFLGTYLKESKVDQVVIIAHSMGSRIVASALIEMGHAHPALARKLLHVVLAA
ncbi:MAG: hypothetical protein JWQ73_1511 [Variovorax sp.]|nr:hypothetical protein [Variovorax sp.]